MSLAQHLVNFANHGYTFDYGFMVSCEKFQIKQANAVRISKTGEEWAPNFSRKTGKKLILMNVSKQKKDQQL